MGYYATKLLASLKIINSHGRDGEIWVNEDASGPPSLPLRPARTDGRAIRAPPTAPAPTLSAKPLRGLNYGRV